MKKILLALVAISIFTSSAQAKDDRPVVAVLEFKNETQAEWFQNGVGRELGDMLANELLGTGVFKVVERKKIESVMNEQDFGASGRVSKRTAAAMGRITGAQYLISGSVASFEQKGRSGGGFSFKGISIGGKGGKASISVDLRVVNATTGEIEYARTVEATTKSSGMSLGLARGGFGGRLANEKKTPVGKAIRAVLIEATDYLACVMYDQDSCLREYRNKDRKRRSRTKSAVSLD